MTGLAPVAGVAVSDFLDAPPLDNAFIGRDLVYLVVMNTSSADNRVDKTYYMADRAYISQPGDTEPNQYFEPRVDSVDLTRSVALDPASESDGSQSCDIQIRNDDGELDNAVAREIVDGKTIKVLTGDINESYDQFTTIYTGQLFRLESSSGGNSVSINSRGIEARLEQTLNGTYGSSYGEVTVDSSVEGSYWPVLYGKAFFIRPVLINADKLVYHVNGLRSGSIDNIYIRGDDDIYVSAGVADDLDSKSLADQEYLQDTDDGLFRLGSEPDGEIIVEADDLSPVLDNHSAAKIAEQAIEDLLGNNSGFVDNQSFDDLDTYYKQFDSNNYGYAAQFYSTEQVSVKDVLREVIIKGGAYWYTSREGKIAVDRLKLPKTGEFIIDFDDTNILSLNRRPAPDALYPPHKGRLLRYQRVIGGPASDVSDQAESTVRSDLMRGYRTSLKGSVLAIAHPLAQQAPTIESPFSRFDAAAGVNEDLLIRNEVNPAFYELTTDTRGLKCEMGSTVRVTYSRFGLDKKAFKAFPVRESSRDRTVTLLLWAHRDG